MSAPLKSKKESMKEIGEANWTTSVLNSRKEIAVAQVSSSGHQVIEKSSISSDQQESTKVPTWKKCRPVECSNGRPIRVFSHAIEVLNAFLTTVFGTSLK